MKKKAMILALAVGTVTCLMGCGAKEAGAAEMGKVSGTVSTDGSTSMEKVIGALGEAFMEMNKDASFTYNPTGSGSGITAAENGTCDIGLSSRHLKEEELAKGLEETELAIDGIAVIVNINNEAQDLTLEEIADIYTGEITNWSEVGGADAEIVVIGREAGSGTRDGFESITGTEDACVLRQELTSTGDVIATVKSNENAIGYASLASVKDDVAMVAVDGVEPSSETILDGSYAIQRPFILVTKEDRELSEAAQAFMDFALSEDAMEIIVSAGVVPAAQEL
ncbi:MAG: phosphate ABC transporter substrate-binding protein [Eubacterium sp.]|nr:phosphate ABC transporter substrate-binding protein [Eubacterium sp.]